MIIKRNLLNIALFSTFLVLGVLFLKFVLAIAPTWTGTDVNYTLDEDTNYNHNLTKNISGWGGGGVTFAINTIQTNITWTNASGTFNVSQSDISGWISITNSTAGNLTINATFNNQTGFFTIPIEAKNTTDDAATTDIFEFMINATNDAPNFTNISSTYNLTQNQNFYRYVNASDEEVHFPLKFNITFISNCTLASWSNRGAGNCSLFSFSTPTNTSAFMNFTPTKNDVGTYWANITVMDAADQSSCPHPFCVNSTYKVNRTVAYTPLIIFNVQTSLEINTTNCDNNVFQENQLNWCIVNITTKSAADTINISTYSILRNYPSGQSNVANTSWFYENDSTASVNFSKTINVTVRPGKTEIGNWTINFTVNDITENQNSTAQIYIFVNRTTNHAPDIISISNINTSINLQTIINFSVYDNDTLIPDKNSSFGGINETITFNRTILNQSNLNQQLTLSNFSITILTMPTTGTNLTTAEIRFTPNSSDVGNYTINVTVNDSTGLIDFMNFNLTILNNNAPQWNLTNLNTTFLIYENNNTNSNLSRNATDPDGDTLTFSYINDTVFPSFSLGSSNGTINFTANDFDVGQHIVNITISDGYLTNTTSFNFTIFNINDNPVFFRMDATNTTPSGSGAVTNNSNINLTEDNYTTFNFWSEDEDLKIPSSQKSFYNESLTINVTISGPNSTLFNFIRDSSWPTANFPNRTKHDATFTPKKADVGNYNVTINITDASNLTTYINFTMIVIAINHNPVVSSLSNQSTAVNRTLTLNINATDIEDGNDSSSSNFTFSYTNLTGLDFINNNQSRFNTTSGLLNVTFNSTQAGLYRINITVNDSSGLIDFEDFWIHIYGPATLFSPAEGVTFNLVENTTSKLNFTLNHTIGDNLTYDFYTDFITYNGSYNYSSLVLRNSNSSYGNGTNYSLTFTPNMSDETYSQLKNLTLVAYPTTTNLENGSNVNLTVNFKLNITHINSPITFTGTIGDRGPVSHDNDITINLASYFSDLDYNDFFYNQSVTFTVNSNTSSITSSVSSSWVLTLSSSVAVTGLVNITGSDGSTNATSDSFKVIFVDPTGSSSTTTSSGGGSSTISVPVSLNLILPDPVSAFKKDRIVLPVTLHNDGSATLYDITLAGSIVKDSILAEDINISFSQTHFASLTANQKENLTMIVEINTDESGTYELNINATVKSPYYVDWGKMFITIKEGENVEEKIIFTEEFIVQNPECIELLELVDEAKALLSRGSEEEALKKANEALTACREAIAQAGKSKIREIVGNNLYLYLIISTIVVFIAGIVFYSYKRMVLRRKRSAFLQESIKNKKYLG